MSQSIGTLNNEAVSLLQNGSFEVAIKTLKLAVNSFASSKEGKDTLPLTTSSASDPPLHMDSDSDASIRSVEIDIRCGDNGSSKAANQNNSQFLFQRALLVVVGESSVQLKSSVVLYNLALIHHILGVQECASKKLMGAKRLYLLALDLVKKHSQCNGSKKALLLSLAIANNLGEIYLQQSHDADEAKKCFSLVHEILRHLDLQQQEVAAADPDVNDYSFFYLNAMVRGTGDIVVATAA